LFNNHNNNNKIKYTILNLYIFECGTVYVIIIFIQIILLCVSGVGKTCITRQFLYHEFDAKELTTIGIHLYINYSIVNILHSTMHG